MIDVKRSLPPPNSLEERKTVRTDEVVERLAEDFLGKCYLCETPVGRAGFEIDHRVPKSVDPSREYDWNNLFPACRLCNGGRQRRWPEGGLLDPAGGDGVEVRLIQRLEVGASDKHEPMFAARNTGDLAASNTAAELVHLHSGNGIPRADLRDAIRAQALRVAEQVMRLQELEQEGHQDTDVYRDCERRLQRLVSRRAPYTMLVRSVVPRAVAYLFD